MSNEGYYRRFLKYKKDLDVAVEEDSRLQTFAEKKIGIKPQGVAVDMVARSYSAFCSLFNKLCDVYDQMQQVQRREYLKRIIDALTCRILELKATLEDIEAFEYTYYDNGIKQMFMIPDDVQILCPHFYCSEARDEEMQYIVDQIMSGNRIGDPTPTPSEIERREEERLEEERIKREEKEAEVLRLLAMGEEVPAEEAEVVYTPEQLEEIRRKAEFDKNIANIQRMARARFVIFAKIQKANKDRNLYLELAGLKKKSPAHFQQKAALFIQKIYRRFMELKREHVKDFHRKVKLDMVIPSYQPPSQHIRLAEVKEARRQYRRQYFKEWMDRNVKEKDKILKWKEGKIMEDISQEIRQWFKEWWNNERVFDEYPWPEEGGSILVVRGETFTLPEYEEWRRIEEKRLKMEAQTPKSKEEIKAEKQAEKEEKKRIAADKKEKEKKELENYKKMRLSPDNDPGVYIQLGAFVDPVLENWRAYENEWKAFDTQDPILTAIKGYIAKLVIEHKYKEVHMELRPIVDEVMKIELNLLRAANKTDFDSINIKVPITMKRKRPKKNKPPKPEKTPPKVWFQKAVDEGLVVKYPKLTLADYWGDRNYAAADERAILWTPKFTDPGLGDVQEQVRVKCILALGAECPKLSKTQLIVGPKGFGKRSLAYAVATETNSILIDLSPYHVNRILPGKNKILFQLAIKSALLMQPTVILVHQADKLFYKKVPKEEKELDPTRLSKDFLKEIVKYIKPTDKIMVIGTAVEPWIANAATMKKSFPQVILLPNSDYGSLSYILTKELMTYHGVDREFNVHSLAQAIRGYDVSTLRKSIKKVLCADRILQLKYKPLEPMEILNQLLADDEAVYTDDFDYDLYRTWYKSYTPWGAKYNEYMFMLNSQYECKLKEEKNKK